MLPPTRRLPFRESIGTAREDVAPPAGASEDGAVFTTALAGVSVELHAERALFWSHERTLFVADVHLGKAAAFRAGGVALPRGTTAADLARLTALVARTGAQRLVVLGDLLHAAAGRVAALDAAFVRWRNEHRSLELVLVRGNHDARSGDPPRTWGVRVVDAPHALAPFLACHEPASPRTGYALCGHLHPGVRVGGAGFDSARVPCFVLRPRQALLPAFGRFTGLSLVDPASDTQVVAIAGTRLFALRNPSR